MKILFISDFRLDSPGLILNNPGILSKGFIRNGHDVLPFSYRDMLLGLSPIRSKKWALIFAKKKTDQLLLELARHYEPDLIFLASFKLLDVETIIPLRELFPKATMMCWSADMYDGIDPKVEPLARQCDWLLSVGGGEILRAFKNIGIAHCAFMPFPSDPDFQYPRTVSSAWQSELLFTGKLRHNLRGQDPSREEIIKYLVNNKGMTIWGDMGRPQVQGLDYLRAICGANIAVSINAFNHIRFYHSDRPVHYLGCGSFTLAKTVPDSDLLFEHQKHLCYFSGLDDCLELIDRYQKDGRERKRIAAAGMKHVHETFCYTKLSRYIIDLIHKGEFNEPWCEVI